MLQCAENDGFGLLKTSLSVWDTIIKVSHFELDIRKIWDVAKIASLCTSQAAVGQGKVLCSRPS